MIRTLFLRSFKQRLVDMFIQQWSEAVRDKDRYEIYRSFKMIFEKEKYISNTDIYIALEWLYHRLDLEYFHSTTYTGTAFYL